MAVAVGVIAAMTAAVAEVTVVCAPADQLQMEVQSESPRSFQLRLKLVSHLETLKKQGSMQTTLLLPLLLRLLKCHSNSARFVMCSTQLNVQVLRRVMGCLVSLRRFLCVLRPIEWALPYRPALSAQPPASDKAH